MTVAGEGRDLAQAVLPGAVKAVELIDMKKHRGQHPRFGAVDVAPFVPIADSTIDSCSELAKDSALSSLRATQARNAKAHPINH